MQLFNNIVAKLYDHTHIIIIMTLIYQKTLWWEWAEGSLLIHRSYTDIRYQIISSIYTAPLILHRYVGSAPEIVVLPRESNPLTLEECHSL